MLTRHTDMHILCLHSQDLRDFLLRTFVKDPQQRWTAAQLLEHPFILQSRDTTQATSPTETLPFLSPKVERTTGARRLLGA